jgi:hypothetical protein
MTVRTIIERAAKKSGVRPRIYLYIKPRGAGWVVKRTGPYTPIISFSGLTIYRLFILSFI